MEVSFKNKRLKELLSDDKKTTKKYGAICAKKVRTRLDDLKAAPCLEEFKHLPGRCHELKGQKRFQLLLDLKHPLRLIFEPTDINSVKKEDSGINWVLIIAVTVICIEDTHE